MACSAAAQTDASALTGAADFATSPSYLGDTPLPARSGATPSCMTCLPHAQMDQQSPDDIFALLKSKANAALGNAVVTGKSTVSMPSTYPAFHLGPMTGSMPAEACMTPGGPQCGREFAHIHTVYRPDSDPFVAAQRRAGAPWQSYQGGGQGSLHLCLTLRDAAAVLASGWGERHLLAGKTMGSARIPRGLVLVYAPRDGAEVDVALRVLKASLAFAQSGGNGL